jgi:hypothetical protein
MSWTPGSYRRNNNLHCAFVDLSPRHECSTLKNVFIYHGLSTRFWTTQDHQCCGCPNVSIHDINNFTAEVEIEVIADELLRDPFHTIRPPLTIVDQDLAAIGLLQSEMSNHITMLARISMFHVNTFGGIAATAYEFRKPKKAEIFRSYATLTLSGRSIRRARFRDRRCWN